MVKLYDVIDWLLLMYRLFSPRPAVLFLLTYLAEGSGEPSVSVVRCQETVVTSCSVWDPVGLVFNRDTCGTTPMNDGTTLDCQCIHISSTSISDDISALVIDLVAVTTLVAEDFVATLSTPPTLSTIRRSFIVLITIGKQ